METEGPPLETVLRRIAEVPADFLAEPRVANTGTVVVCAVVYDLARSLGIALSEAELASFSTTDRKRDAEKLATVLLLCWILQDEWVQQKKPEHRALVELLTETANQLASNASAARYINDPDRREELARLVLSSFALRPAGESRAQAQDRLTSISSVERTRVLKASRAAEERSRAIREALAKKAAEESADKWTRE